MYQNMFSLLCYIFNVGFQPELTLLGVTVTKNLAHRAAITFIGEKGLSITKQAVVANGKGPLVRAYSTYLSTDI